VDSFRDKIRTVGTAATDTGAVVGTALSDGLATAGGAVDSFRDKIRTQIPISATEAAGGMKDVLAAQAAAAAEAITADIGGSLSDLVGVSQDAAGDLWFVFDQAAGIASGAITRELGGSITGLSGKATKTAGDIETTFGRIKIPEITIPARVDLDSSAIDRLPDDIRIRTGMDTTAIPGLATGGIVMKKTLAFVGESGPEAVIPLGRAIPQGTQTLILEVDGRIMAEVIVPKIPGVVQRYRLA
jgi:hypothetical protein